jgi:hypothetical protein
LGKMEHAWAGISGYVEGGDSEARVWDKVLPGKMPVRHKDFFYCLINCLAVHVVLA